MAQILQWLVESYGYEAAVADSGVAAIAQMRDVNPDLVLMDVKMPAMDGYEACRCIKADPATKEIPVVMLSASSSNFDLTAGFEVGAAAYLTKPFDNKEVIETITRLIG